VPNAGHASPWDNPEFFNRTVREFLAQTAGSTRAESDSSLDSSRR